jgi:Rrf2 family protein
MKFSAQEEYGLRCLLHIGRMPGGKSCTIPEISRMEGISSHNVAKFLRILRQSGFLQSVRGQAGGYTLARPASQIILGDVLRVLGGRLYEPDFFIEHSGMDDLCPHSVDCAIRSLWSRVQLSVDQVLSKTTLQDLLITESQFQHEQDRSRQGYSSLVSLA